MHLRCVCTLPLLLTDVSDRALPSISGAGGVSRFAPVLALAASQGARGLRRVAVRELLRWKLRVLGLSKDGGMQPQHSDLVGAPSPALLLSWGWANGCPLKNKSAQLGCDQSGAPPAARQQARTPRFCSLLPAYAGRIAAHGSFDVSHFVMFAC